MRDKSILFKVVDLGLISLAGGFFFLLRRSPDFIANRLSVALVTFLRTLMPRERMVARRNLELCFPEMDYRERERIRRASYRVFARHMVLFSRVANITPEMSGAMEGAQEFESLIERLRMEHPSTGILFPTLHYGPFEYLVQLFTVRVGPLSMLARGFGFPSLDRWWNRRRQIFGSRVFFRLGGYRELQQRLAKGEDVTLLFDQNVRIHHAVFVPFFGHLAATTKGVALAALRTGAPVVALVGYENSPGKLAIYFEEFSPAEFGEGELAERIERFTARLNQFAERVIRLHPEQWLWIHRRFKTRPAGEPESIYLSEELRTEPQVAAN